MNCNKKCDIYENNVIRVNNLRTTYTMFHRKNKIIAYGRVELDGKLDLFVKDYCKKKIVL